MCVCVCVCMGVFLCVLSVCIVESGYGAESATENTVKLQMQFICTAVHLQIRTEPRLTTNKLSGE